jgi:hypothetical protein
LHGNGAITNPAYASTNRVEYFLVVIIFSPKFEAWLVAAGRAEGPAGAEFQSQEKNFLETFFDFRAPK